MITYKYPLASTTWDEAEFTAIQRVIDSGMFTMGEKVQEFEQNFAKYIGSRYAVMVNSGSSANLLMTAALFYTKNDPLRAGDEVIVPAVSWSTTYYPLYQYGLKIRFVDIDMDTLNYDLQKLAAAVTEQTRLIVAVNLLGNPNDFDVIKNIIKDKPILLIEDNCESMGAEFHGRKTGTFGLMGSFSSFFSHHISTMEGGIVVTDNEELYHILLCLRAHGWTRNLPQINHVCGKKSDDPFTESFHFVLPGYNVRPLELSGAIGIEQIKKLPNIIDERKKNGAFLIRLMEDHPDILIQKEIGCSSWFGFSLVIRPGSSLTRKILLEKLRSAGFECRPIVAGDFTKNKVMKFLNAEISGKIESAKHIDKYGLFIGNHHYSMEEPLKILQQTLC